MWGTRVWVLVCGEGWFGGLVWVVKAAASRRTPKETQEPAGMPALQASFRIAFYGVDEAVCSLRGKADSLV
jgi:hypothetical protein